MTESFSVSLLARSVENSGSRKRFRLKEVTEHWRPTNRRGHGHYAKPPGSSIMNHLQSSLIVPVTDINSGLVLPNLSCPTWLNLAIGMVLSIGTIRDSPPRSTSMATPLLIDVANFVESWCTLTKDQRSTKTKSEALSRLLKTQIDIPDNVSINCQEQTIFLLHHLLLPLVNRPMTAMKIHRCSSCNYSIRKYETVNYIPINLVNGQLHVRNELATYFSSSTSDVMCHRCRQPMDRRIELLDCKTAPILWINLLFFSKF